MGAEYAHARSRRTIRRRTRYAEGRRRLCVKNCLRKDRRKAEVAHRIVLNEEFPRILEEYMRKAKETYRRVMEQGKQHQAEREAMERKRREQERREREAA